VKLRPTDKDRDKIAQLDEGEWSSIPPAFAQAIDERYAAFVRRRAT